MPATKEFVVDAALGGAWVNRTPHEIIQMGVDGITPEDICNAVSVKNYPFPVLIGIVATSPPCGINTGMQVANKQHYISP